MYEFERAVSYESLFMAFESLRVKNSKTCGVDEVSINDYNTNLYDNLQMLHYSLISNQYIPYREKVFISKKGRKIYISCLEDKIVQTAIAKVISELLTLNPSIHSFIKGRSIFTAYSMLKKYINSGIDAFYKIDIKKFYESISSEIMLKKLENVTSDRRFLSLVRCILYSHPSGISTGSCLSPTLSNLYMKDFDHHMVKEHGIYLRYVDDMLVSSGNEEKLNVVIKDVKDELSKINLSVNQEKSKVVQLDEGFKYLGFDIKRYRQMDELLDEGRFLEADGLINSHNDNLDNDDGEYIEDKCTNKENASDVFTKNNIQKETIDVDDSNNDFLSNAATTINPDITKDEKTESNIPVYILAIEKKCHTIKYLINKAKTENFLSYPEKRVLLYIFKCLGDDGTKYLHKILGYCIDYDYNTTQGYIDRCNISQPIGCKKICELFDGVCDKACCCKCNFKNEKIYPTPLIHAMRQNSSCFKMPVKAESTGHFKRLPVKADINNTLSKVIELNKKSHEINMQKEICKNHLEDLFERNEYTQIDTPYGLLIKNEDGVFIKIG